MHLGVTKPRLRPRSSVDLQQGGTGLCRVMRFPAFEDTSVEKETLLRIYLAYISYELSTVQLERLQVISGLPGNEDHSR